MKKYIKGTMAPKKVPASWRRRLKARGLERGVRANVPNIQGMVRTRYLKWAL
jgi:hypothetical protein